MLDAGRQKAKVIAQTALDETGAALIACDFDAFSRHFATPYTLATEGGIACRRNLDELRAGFHDAVDHYRRIGVTRLDRVVEDAIFDGPDKLRYSHLTRLMGGDALLHTPYPNIWTMRHDGDRWLTIATEHIVSDPETFGSALLRTGQQHGDDADAAKPIFQDVLDRATRAYLTSDFKLLTDTIRLPLFMQGSAARRVFATPAELEADFRHYMHEFTVHEITDIVRLVKTAVRAGPDRIHGTYRTHILCGTRLFLPAYTSAMTLERDTDDTWRISTVMHPLGHWSPAVPRSEETARP